VVSIEVPPLRERRDEILPLAEHFLEKHCQPDAEPPALTEDLRMAFLKYDWPGNVRELENVVRRYLVFEDAPRLVQQLLARSSARAASAGLAAGAAAGVGDARVAAGAGSVEKRLPEGSGRNAAFREIPPAPAQSVAAPLPEVRQAVPEHSAANGTKLGMPPEGIVPAPFHDAARVPAEAGGPNAVGPVPADALPTAIWSAGRTDKDAQLAAALRQAAPENTDGWMSRLARLESLLGCLVLGASEKASTEAEAVPEEPKAAPLPNGHEVVTLAELDEQRNQAEMEAILAALDKTEWNRRKAAKLLKTDYKALLYRMKKLGIGERNFEA
jgi:DNA-binding NtrC family response regulator